MAILNSLGIPDTAGLTATLMPKLQFKFRVNFLGNAFKPELTRNVISMNRPTLSHEEITVDAYNSKIYLAGKHTWEAVSIHLRDDVDGTTLKELNAQLALQVDHATQSSTKAGAGYKFETVVETLDGTNPIPGVLDSFVLSGCFINNINYGDLGYANSEQVMINVSLRYDNVEIRIAGGDDTLSGIEQNNDPSGATGGGTT